MSSAAADYLGISRQAVNRHLRALESQGVIRSTGRTKSKSYHLASTLLTYENIAVHEDLAEHEVWQQNIQPHLESLSRNLIDLSGYCCTEMVNNVVDHSQSDDMYIVITSNAISIDIIIVDHGIGIFRKVRHALGLEGDQHAMLELSKGKLTTDPDHHTGEGLFFSSRMCSSFTIESGSIVFIRLNEDDWLFEFQETEPTGTAITMTFMKDTELTSKEVFDRYTSEHEDFGFTKTHVPVNLARYEGEKLVSRSQAKRLLTRSDGFREVFLDFQGVESIGPAFADEIFRVFAIAHPDISITYARANEEVDQMIKRAIFAKNLHDKLGIPSLPT